MEPLFNALLQQRSRKIIAVAKNYFAHAVEMGGVNVPESPVMFLKPHSSLVGEGTSIELPDTEVHHEVELGVMIGQGGKNIQEESALQHVGGYFIALDLTAREI
jgi:acylpyruvate hydrolase